MHHDLLYRGLTRLPIADHNVPWTSRGFSPTPLPDQLSRRDRHGMAHPLRNRTGNDSLVIARLRTTATQPIGVILPKLPTPFADGFVGHGDTTFAQEFLHVAIAQGEAIVEPDAMTDNFTGKAVVLVTLGVGRRGYVWAGGNYVMAQAGWSTKGAAPRRAWPRRAPSAVTQTRRARSASG